MSNLLKIGHVHGTKNNLLVQNKNIPPDIARLYIFKSAECIVNKQKTPGM